MADGLRFGRFEVDRSGVAETLRGGGVTGWVASVAASVAASANASAEENATDAELNMLRHYDPFVTARTHYEPLVRAGRFDTLGVVRSASLLGAYDSNQHHTLDTLNH